MINKIKSRNNCAACSCRYSDRMTHLQLSHTCISRWLCSSQNLFLFAYCDCMTLKGFCYLALCCMMNLWCMPSLFSCCSTTSVHCFHFLDFLAKTDFCLSLKCLETLLSVSLSYRLVPAYQFALTVDIESEVLYKLLTFLLSYFNLN